MPKKPVHQKLWTIRMPADLLEQLRKGAETYALPPQTFAKLIMRSGLIHLKKSGDLLTTREDAQMLERHQRRLIVENTKAQEGQAAMDAAEDEADAALEQAISESKAPPEEEDPYRALIEFTATLKGGSEVKGELVNTTQATSALIDNVVDDVSEKELLADIGGDRSLPPRSDESDDEDDIASILSSI